MGSLFPIINTKLTPPILRKKLLRRPSLIKRIRSIHDYPLTILHSGPGYGKSTTMANFIKDTQIDYCWYTVTKQDDDLGTFINYLIHSIQTKIPEFCQDLLNNLEIVTNNMENICARVVNQLNLSQGDLILIIDDYHLIDHSDSIDLWMQEFIHYLPHHIHLVVSTRTRPTWELLTSLKAKALLLEIDESDFRFTYDEIEVLIADFYEMSLDPEFTNLIFNKTEGWIMAIQMIAQQLSEEQDLQSLLKNDSLSLEDLFQFLASDVLSKLPEKIKSFLIQACVFDELNHQIIVEVLKLEYPEDYLSYISRQNLFLYTVGEKQYRFHALFREFLLQEFKRTDPYRFIEINRLAAHYFNTRQDYDQAINHYTLTGDHQAIADILYSYGKVLLKMGRLDRLQETLTELPISIRKQEPMLLIYEGEIYRYRCFYNKGATCYLEALEILNKKQNDIRIPLSLEGLARIYLDTIQPAKASTFVEKAIKYINDNMQLNDTELTVSLYRLMAENLINLGRAKEADLWVKQSQQLLPNQHFKENIEARLYLRTGRLKHAKKILDRQKALEREEENHLQLSHRETDLLLSLIYSFDGEIDHAKYSAQEGMLQGIKYKAPFVEACGWIRMGHAVQLSPHYDLDHAFTCYNTALDIMESISVSRGKAEPLMGLGILCCKRGDFKQAKYYADIALKETEKADDGWLSALIKICISMIYYYEADYNQSLKQLKGCETAFITCGDHYGLSVTYLWRALNEYEKAEWDSFKDTMSQLLKKVKGYSYEFLLERPTLFGPIDLQNIAPLLIEARDLGIGNDDLAYLLSKLNITKDHAPPGYTIKVQMLGEFRVWLGPQEIQSEDWRRDKAKELFQYLLTYRSRWVQREKILADLWSNQDETSSTAGLKVALNTLNKVLEPHRKARQKPYYIDRRDTSYRIRITSGIDIDLLYFEEFILKGLQEQHREQAQHWLEKGLSYYKGEFLLERYFEDWCIEERERLHVLFLRGIEKLAQIHVSFEKYDMAIHWCEEIVRNDACWEEAYRLIIYCYYKKNNRPQAIKWYQRCQYELKVELEVEPMPATKEIYQLMIDDKVNKTIN